MSPESDSTQPRITRMQQKHGQPLNGCRYDKCHLHEFMFQEGRGEEVCQRLSCLNPSLLAGPGDGYRRYWRRGGAGLPGACSMVWQGGSECRMKSGVERRWRHTGGNTATTWCRVRPACHSYSRLPLMSLAGLT